jgi:hypothetical protein
MVQAWQSAPSTYEIHFAPPIEGTCTLNSGGVIRGRIVSVGEQQIVMINNQNREVTLEPENIRVLRTSDGEFQYMPATDDYADAMRRAESVGGVGFVPVFGESDTQQQPNQPPAGIQNNPITPNPPVGVADTSSPSDFAATGQSTNYSSTPGFTTPNPGLISGAERELPRCGTCGNAIRVELSTLQSCPYCGVLFTPTPYSPTVGVPAEIASSGPTGTHTGGGGATAAPPAGQVVSNTPPASSPAGNFSFDAMPIWAKAGAFIGFIFVLYMVISSRR